MLKLPLVSVEMITYNHAPYIAQAIEGVLSQKTDFPYELVIGEDCSTDGTREIVFRYAEAHPDFIRLVTSKSNVGSDANSRRTSEACRGKYIAWCEGDDYWHREDKLQLQVNYLDSHAECGLVCADYDVLHAETGKRIQSFLKHRRVQVPEQFSVYSFLGSGNPTFLITKTCTIVARRDLVEKIKSRDPYLHRSGRFQMGDTQLWAEMAEVSTIHFIDESLATHRILKNSMSNTVDPIKKARFVLSCYELTAYLCEKYNVDRLTKCYHDELVSHHLLRTAFLERNIDLARQFRARRNKLTFKEFLMYHSIKNKTTHRALKTLLHLKSIGKTNYQPWN